jgi:hypothetical protein
MSNVHDDVMELSLERRNGYEWNGEEPAQALAVYAQWKKSTGAGAASK